LYFKIRKGKEERYNQNLQPTERKPFRSEWLYTDCTIHTTCLRISGTDVAEIDEKHKIKVRQK